jgi:cytosine/adenosine deaminase-related metal-dependent hydrolase
LDPKTTHYKARWIYPVDSPPIENGQVSVSGGKIISVGPEKAKSNGSGNAIDLGQGVILPALINAHTHLELSALKVHIEPGLGFLPWVKRVLALRESLTERECLEAIQNVSADLSQQGIVAIGDWISFLNSNRIAWPAKIIRCAFHEVIGFSEERFVLPSALDSDSERRTLNAELGFDSLGAHAPHTTSASLLKSAKAWTTDRELPLSIHVAESLEEEDFLLNGGGPWGQLLRDRGRWVDPWTPPGMSSVAYLDSLGLLNKRTQCIHLTRASFSDLEIMKRREARIVVCPRSNAFITGGLPLVLEMVRLGIAPALGTDSLASNQDLDLWEEMNFLSRSFPSLASEKILQMATLNGATSLGLVQNLGSISPGKRAAMLFLPLTVPSLRDLPTSIIESGGKNVRWLNTG